MLFNSTDQQLFKVLGDLIDQTYRSIRKQVIKDLVDFVDWFYLRDLSTTWFDFIYYGFIRPPPGIVIQLQDGLFPRICFRLTNSIFEFSSGLDAHTWFHVTRNYQKVTVCSCYIAIVFLYHDRRNCVSPI